MYNPAVKNITARSVWTLSPADLTGNQPVSLRSFNAWLSDNIGGLAPESEAGRIALMLACREHGRFVRRLGGTTYQYAVWAAVDPRDGEILILRTADDRGAWMNARCRPWNGGDRL